MQPRYARIRALDSAGADWDEAERAAQAIPRNVTFLMCGVAGVVCCPLLYAVGLMFTCLMGGLVVVGAVAAHLLSRRGHGRQGTLLFVVVVNVAFTLAVIERGPGQMEVIHMVSITMPFTLFSFRDRGALSFALGVGVAGIIMAQLPIFPPPAEISAEAASQGAMIATLGVGLVVPAQLLVFSYVRHELLQRLRRVLGEAQRADAAKNAFVATISHELRTPMNGVLGMLDVLRDAGGAEQQERVEEARESASALLSVIDGVLDPSRIERGSAAGARDTRDPAPVEPDVEQGATVSAAGLRVLVVDDNLINLMVAERMLAKLGCDVDVVSSGAEAVERSGATGYAMIFMDIQMPLMDGLQATELIRSQERDEGRGRRVPIVALTAHAMVGDRERYLAAGMDAYLSKPARREQFGAVVARFTRAGAPGLEPTFVP